MKISKLEFKNCLGIKELKLEPGSITYITGGNAKGKTSILEAIEKAISNKDRRARFVNDEADKAELYIELDNGIKIDRKVTGDNKSTVRVTSGDFTQDKPETFLKSLLGGFGFNPIDFIQEKEETQAEMLLNVIDLKVSIDDLEGMFENLPDGINYHQHPLKIFKQLEKKYYDARTEANSAVKTVKNEINAIFNQLPENYKADDYRSVVLADLYKEIDEKQKVNDNIAKSKELLSSNKLEEIKDTYNKLIESKTKEIDLQIAKLEAQKEGIIKTLKSEEETKYIEIQNHIEIAKKYIESHTEYDISELKEKAENIEKMKNYINLFDNRTRLQEELVARESKAKLLDEQVNIARTKPFELLQAFKLPVEGLSFSDDMKLLINDRPIKNLSTAEQIKVALDIAKATAGELKVICIDKFENLDDDNKKLVIEELKKDDEFNYFITGVTSGEMKIEGVK